MAVAPRHETLLTLDIKRQGKVRLAFEAIFSWMMCQLIGDYMWKIVEDFAEEAVKQGLEFEIMGPLEAERFHHGLLAKFGKSKAGWPLWDGPSDFASVQDELAWRWIGDWIKNEVCVLLWDPASERRALRFAKGRGLISLLECVYGTEFYVTDESMSYMICFNHHDYLIAAGRATEWLKQHPR